MRRNKKTERASQFEKCYRILEFLRKNTDEKHKLNQSDIKNVKKMLKYTGGKGTLNDNINVIADTLNYNEDGSIKKEAEWPLVFDAFKEENGDANLENDTELAWQIENEKGVLPRRPVKNIYYKSAFSHDDINAMEEGILFSKTIGTEEAKKLIDKIEKNLANVHYNGLKNICTVYEPDLMDRELLKNNLLLIAEAINKHIQITMKLCSYNSRNELEPSTADKQYLSPYYLVAYGGRYYLLCAYETPGKRDARHQMYILRVDLMIDIELPEYERDHNKKKGIPVTPKLKVENLPPVWNDEFQISHLNMTYGQPIRIKLRISTVSTDERTGKQKKLPYTFLHDWFGNTYRRLGPDPENENYDLIQFRCPAFAMENWAMQYSDRVEVLEPAEVRNRIKKKVADDMMQIINETAYFVRQCEVPGVVTRWKQVNPILIYFDCAFDLMEQCPQEYEAMRRGLTETRLSCYPDAYLLAERNAYFKQAQKRYEHENRAYSENDLFQEELQHTLTLLFEETFREYL